MKDSKNIISLLTAVHDDTDTSILEGVKNFD